MEKQTKTIIIGLVLIIAIVLLFGNQLGLFASTSGSVARSTDSTVSPGETFSVTYTAQSTGDEWGVSILDSVSGGCEFLGLETEERYVLLNDAPTVTITVVAPQSGTCTFSGDYKFGTGSIVNMADRVVTVSGTPENCTNGDTKCEDGSAYTCISNEWVGILDTDSDYSSICTDDDNGGTTLGDSWKVLLIFLAVILIVKFALDRYGKK